MREEGLFDNILNQSSSSRSAMNRNGIDIGEAQRFITDTDAVLAEIASLENAEIQLQFIEALFNGGTVGDIAAVFALESQDLADRYLNAISSITQLSNATSSRSATSNVMDIKLAYYTYDHLANRRASLTLATTGVAAICYATSTGRLVINFIGSVPIKPI